MSNVNNHLVSVLRYDFFHVLWVVVDNDPVLLFRSHVVNRLSDRLKPWFVQPTDIKLVRGRGHKQLEHLVVAFRVRINNVLVRSRKFVDRVVDVRPV